MAAIPTITLETGQIEDIPLLSCIPVQQEPCPVVFFIPGFWGNKASGLSLAYRLAGRGLACISLDPLYHGDRYHPRSQQAAEPAFGGIYPPDTGLDIGFVFFQVIRQCSLDIQTLLAALANDTRLNLQRAGVTGFSLGGYASFLALAEIPALSAAVPMMGIPTFVRRWQDLLDECTLSNPTWAVALAQVEAQTRQYTAFIRSIDPAERLKRAVPRALLMMNGDFDSDQPKHYTLSWYREARPEYAHCPERLQWNVYPTGHGVTPQMEEDAVEWFSKYLTEQRLE
jgi:pimeloyl-ACP methyl ester carboxylesterase